MNCFYCDKELTERELVKGEPVPADTFTWDHVVPRKLGRPMDSPYREHYVRDENTVPACPPCNTRKGSKDPFHWLGSYRLGDAGAERLRDQLLVLGFDPERVERAWKHRVAGLANRASQLEINELKRVHRLETRFRNRESGQDGNAAAC